MIFLLIAIAAVATVALVAPSFTILSKATATDATSRGPWGVLEWDWRRTRKLDAHERRWQTALISSSEQPSRWRDFVAEIERLERDAELSSDPSPPADFDRSWVVDRLNRLEAQQIPPDQETQLHE